MKTMVTVFGMPLEEYDGPSCASPRAIGCTAIDARPERQRALEHSFNRGQHVFVSPAMFDRLLGMVGRHPHGSSELCWTRHRWEHTPKAGEYFSIDRIDRGSR